MLGIIPPLLAAGTAMLVAPHMAAPVADVSGSLGTLLGADLTNINKMSSLGEGSRRSAARAHSTVCS
jgi:uncharacterized membrane protein